jgi:hypothetical protein
MKKAAPKDRPFLFIFWPAQPILGSRLSRLALASP